MAWKGTSLAKGYPEFTAKSFKAVGHTQEFWKIEGSIDPVQFSLSFLFASNRKKAEEQ